MKRPGTKLVAVLIGLSLLLITRSAGSAGGNQNGNVIPWTPAYKIRPHQEGRLTAADVVGPDGIVYPNWTTCGVQANILPASVTVRIEDYGAKADDELDDSEALQKACDAVGHTGAVILIGKGTYYLDQPVTVRNDRVVIRGQGQSQTRLIFRYAIPESGVTFFWPRADAKVGNNTRIEMHCRPSGLAKMTLLIDETPIGTWTRGRHSGNTFAHARYGRDIGSEISDGPHKLKAVAKYQDGSTCATEMPIRLDRQFNDTDPAPDSRAAITFAGRGTVGRKLTLTHDGKRGSTELHLESTRGLRVGDSLFIDGPATARWKKLTRNACQWGMYRNYAVVITAIQEQTVSIGQPLRIEFPVVDGSYVQEVVPIQYCGVENLYLEQTENLWITGVLFSHGWNCWARSVTVKKCGRFPVYGSMAKWCEIRDCVFDDAWFKGGGGTAYTGWDRCWDCLMEGVETFKMRHGPLFQWAASGCVIRKSVFHESDAQWHSGWTNENLIEQCVIESVRGHGGYGYGMWASPPEDTAHGPNGPRNVVYNCDISSQRAGLWMGGMNENWLILHNRFVVESGPGVFAKTVSFDHVIKDNAFVLKDKTSPMIHLATTDCVGIEATDNRLHGGNGRIVSGQAGLALSKSNRSMPLAQPERPEPVVPSIYEWQQRHTANR